MKKFLSIIIFMLILIGTFCSCGAKNETEVEHTQVLFTMENGKTFTIELYPEYAPETCENFIKLVNEGFYDGLTFHRVVDNFMAQGGNGELLGRNADEIYGEFDANGFANNTLKHERGVVSMARKNGLNDSASSQFFICYTNCSFLDGQYAAFGKVISGMETIDSFLEIERLYSGGEKSVPVTPIVIEKAVVIGAQTPSDGGSK